MATAIPRYTAEEVRTFPDDRLRYEVIRGELFVTPAPGMPHQLIVSALNHAFFAYFERHPLGVVVPGPFEVQFTDDSAVQPDLLVTLTHQGAQPTQNRLHGPPALVIEIISYSSKRTDRLQKRTLYMEEGVPEYWIVDPGLKQVERWLSGAEQAELFTGRITWRAAEDAPELTIDLKTLFERVAEF